MKEKIWCCIGIALMVVFPLHAAEQEGSNPVSPSASQYRTALNQYCVTCHNVKLNTAGLQLDKADVENVSAGAPLWEKVAWKLRTASMPPAGAPRPDKATYDTFATYLETELDRAAAANPNPGRPAVHRLNRTEYINAVRDLLAIDVDPSLLPADDSASGGFDNIGDALTVSPLLTEKYLSAGRIISRLAIGDPGLPQDSATYNISPDLKQNERASEDLPFGSRGGIVIRHRFPLDGEYIFKIRLQRQELGPDNVAIVFGVAEPHLLDLRLDGARIKLFTVGGENKGRAKGKRGTGFPSEVEQLLYEQTADAALEVRTAVRAGTRVVGVTFPNEYRVAENLRREEDPAVASIVITGPYDAKGPGETPSRAKIFVCRPTGSADEEACAEKILSTLVHRAYRRPVRDSDLPPLLTLYRVGRSNGGFDAGIEMALRGMLVSTGFLFRLERDPANVPPNTPYRISDLELASRLSFFLWSSIPDDELLGLAERGKLRDPAVLEQQVRRMLADSRSRALVSNFAGQWLYLRNLKAKRPSRDLFLEFDENLREAFQRETELFFESMLREDHSVLDLLKADYTFVNERLAQHYGIPNIKGSRYRRVTLADENRRGLLGQGSILTVTSIANRTSPVLRGKWVLEQLLGTPPPDPPANVPALKDKNADGKILSMRAQMEQHRANPFCASCHSRMDPIGFALENFDGIGEWRTTDANAPIDASGVLPDGTKFEGAAGLQKVLLSRPEQIVHTITEKLLIYALGRGVEYYDAPVVRSIVRGAAPSDYRWSSLILGIVKSAPFQMRMSRESDVAAPPSLSVENMPVK